MKKHHQIQADEAKIVAVIFAMGTYFDGVEKISVENKHGCFLESIIQHTVQTNPKRQLS